MENFFRGAIDELSPLLRSPFILHFEQELSDREIAEKLDISDENARKRISQALAILREKFQEYEGEEKSAVSPAAKQRKSQQAKLQKCLETESLASEGLAQKKPIECDEPVLVEAESQAEILLSNSPSVNASCLRSCSEDIEKTFWQLWQQNRDYFYRCCLKWMGGNSMDAEEALSRAMVKAWDKLPDYSEKITNLRAWLTRLTHNLCVDIHRERRRQKAIQIENIEDIATGDNSAVISSCDSPELALLNHELGQYLREAINSLPSRLRTPFTMRYCDEISYQDIAQKLAISLDNIYKRIQQARDILQKRLSRYLSGLDDALLDSPKVGKREKLMVESSQFEETMISASMTGDNIGETINYQVTGLCLETLHYGSYRLLSPLGWS